MTSTTEPIRRPKRVSADLPKHWLNALPYSRLSDPAWRLLTHALMWCIGENNGEVPEDCLADVWPRATPEVRLAAAAEIAEAGVWRRTDSGWSFIDWEATQSTAEQVNANREKWRTKKAAQRSRRAPGNAETALSQRTWMANASSAVSPIGVPRGNPPSEYGTVDGPSLEKRDLPYSPGGVPRCDRALPAASHSPRISAGG